ncbi:hypothetical protein ADEAN_000894100 [Angomonas deanei]|uniref:Uncharacterized protein n=1 Tax=Angomonas deanei TaxID=59799 RepID=A0A7G2CPX9_9TRYP|nr:hypothetical protein ADEAN_000894100 [Angomonas deanei]
MPKRLTSEEVGGKKKSIFSTVKSKKRTKSDSGAAPQYFNVAAERQESMRLSRTPPVSVPAKQESTVKRETRPPTAERKLERVASERSTLEMSRSCAQWDLDESFSRSLYSLYTDQNLIQTENTVDDYEEDCSINMDDTFEINRRSSLFDFQSNEAEEEVGGKVSDFDGVATDVVDDRHGSTVVLLCGKGRELACFNAVDEAVTLVNTKLKKAQQQSEDLFYKLEVSCATTKGDARCVDVLTSKEDEMKAVLNPTAGYWIDGVSLFDFNEEGKWRRVCDASRTWLTRHNGTGENLLLVFLLVRQVHKDRTPLDVYLSSLTIVVGSSYSLLESLCFQTGSPSPLTTLFRKTGKGRSTLCKAFVNDDEYRDTYWNLARRLNETNNEAQLTTGSTARYLKHVNKELKTPSAQRNPDYAKHLEHVCESIERLLGNYTTAPVPFFSYTETPTKKRDLAIPISPVAAKNSPTGASTPPAAAESVSEPALSLCRVYNVAVVDGSHHNVDKSNKVVRTASGQKDVVDEIVSRDAMDSTVVDHLVRDFVAGYNGVLFSVGEDNSISTSSPVWQILLGAASAFFQHRSPVKQLRLSLSVLHKDGKTMDLFHSGDAFHELQVSSSPIFGRSVHDASMKMIKSVESLKSLLATALSSASAHWTSDVVLHASFLSTIKCENDVMVSSFTTVVGGTHYEFLRDIVDGTTHHSICNLVSYTLQSRAEVVFLLFAHDKEAEKVVRFVEASQALKTTKKPVSGSVRKFTEKLQNEVDSLKSEIASSSEKRSGGGNNKMAIALCSVNEKMLTDYVYLLKNPSEEVPQSYLLFKKENKTKDTQRGLPDGPPVRSPSKNLVENKTDPQPPKREKSAPLSFKCHPAVVFLSGRGSIAKSVSVDMGKRNVSWKSQDISVNVDEVHTFDRSNPDDIASLVNQSETINNCCRCIEVGAQNTALLGILDDTPGPLYAAPFWLCFKRMLLSTCFTKSWTLGSDVCLRAVALKDKTAIADLLENDTGSVQHGLKIIASPLVGPVVGNISSRTVNSLKALKTALDEIEENVALLQRGLYISEGTVIVLNAIRKEVRRDDVCLSAVNGYFVRTSKDMETLHDILSLDPHGRSPVSLFRFALSPACRTLCFAVLDSDSTHGPEALRAVDQLTSLKEGRVPTGSLRKYVTSTKKNLDRVPEEEREISSAIVSNYERMLEYVEEEILFFPIEDNTGGMNEAQKEKSNSCPAFCGAVVVGNRSTDSFTAVVTDTNENTVIADGKVYKFDEVHLIAENSSQIRPAFTDELAQRLLSGYNQTLLVTDGMHCSLSGKILHRLTTLIMNRNNALETNVYVSLSSQRFITQFGETRDLLSTKEGGAGSDNGIQKPAEYFTYEPIKMHFSPLFGFSISDHYVPVAKVSDLNALIKNAQSVCAMEKSSLVVSLVVQQVKSSDIVESSLFGVFAQSENTAPNRKVVQMLNAARSTDTFNFLHRAIRNTGHVYSVVGLSSKFNEETNELLSALELFSKVPTPIPDADTVRSLSGCSRSNTLEPSVNSKLPWDKVKKELELLLLAPHRPPKTFEVTF